MKKMISFMLMIVLVLSMCIGCSKSQEDSSKDTEDAKETENTESTKEDLPLEGKTIGFINAGPDDFYAVYNNMFERLVTEAGGTYEYAQSNYDAQTELNNVNDMIIKGVDIIGMIAVSAETSGNAVDLAAEAGIPIFLLGNMTNNSENYTGFAGDDYYGYGAYVAQYAIDNYSDAKMVTIDGVLSQATSIEFRDGFMDTVEKAGLERPVSLGDGNYSKEGALNIMQDMIVSGREFDLVYCANEEEAAGVIQALQEAGIKDKVILTINGKPDALEWIKEGSLTMTVSNAATLAADLAFQQMVAYTKGEDFPRVIRTVPHGYIDSESQDAYIPWEVDEYMELKAEGTELTDMWTYASE